MLPPSGYSDDDDDDVLHTVSGGTEDDDDVHTVSSGTDDDDDDDVCTYIHRVSQWSRLSPSIRVVDHTKE